jgi:putative oxidoreductase
MDKNLHRKNLLFLILRLFFGVLFLYSGFVKITEPVVFAESIGNYQILSIWLSHWGAVLIPALEMVLGFMLLLGLWIKETVIFTAGLFVIFDIMIIQAAVRGLNISCGCFSVSQNGLIDLWKIIENSILTIMIFITLFLVPKKVVRPD